MTKAPRPDRPVDRPDYYSKPIMRKGGRDDDKLNILTYKPSVKRVEEEDPLDLSKYECQQDDDGSSSSSGSSLLDEDEDEGKKSNCHQSSV